MERPPWQWAAIGAAAMMFAWLPLAYLAMLVAQRMPTLAMAVGAPAVALVISSAIGGLVVGRFSEQTGARHAVLGAVVVAGSATALAVPQLGIGAPVALAVAAVMGLAGLGAWLGFSWARRGHRRQGD
jgi:hypothetical protein